MRVTEIGRSEGDGWARLTATVERDGGETFHPFFEVPARHAALITGRADPFLAALVVPAMTLNEPLIIAPPVSRRLAANVPVYVARMTSWFPELSPIQIVCETPAVPESAPPARTVSLFSLGADSFFSVRRAMSNPVAGPLTHVVHIRNIVNAPDDAVAARAERVAGELGLEFVELRTNVRHLFGISWAPHHGSGLAGVGLFLSAGFERFLLPASTNMNGIIPWASSPPLDELWSTETLAIVHDAFEFSRPAKIAALANDPVVLANLQVCFEAYERGENCGRCTKCLRTMLILHLEGTLGRAATFAGAITPEHVNRFPLIRPGDRVFIRNLRRYARERHVTGQFRKAIELRAAQADGLEFTAGRSPLMVQRLIWSSWARSLRQRAGGRLGRNRPLR